MIGKKLKSKSHGMTLVELMVACFISFILMGAMGYTFAEAMNYWTRESQKMQMFDDGSLFLFKLNKAIRRASNISIFPYGGKENARLVMTVPADSGSVTNWRAEYYFVDAEGIIRYNGNLNNRAFYHKKVLPLWDIRTESGGDTTYLKLYSVKFTFTEAGNWPPGNSGPPMVKTELLMRSPKGDTLYMSALAARRNQ